MQQPEIDIFALTYEYPIWDTDSLAGTTSAAVEECYAIYHLHYANEDPKHM